MATVSVAITRPYTGVPLLKQGFRPFFLAASLWAIISITLWLGYLFGLVSWNFAIPMLQWHQHELLFGFSSAVIAGFLLTAGPNWASRPPLAGPGLLGLFILWAIARVALLMLLGTIPPVWLVVALMSFPLVLVIYTATELIIGGAKKNLFVVGIVAVYSLANGVFLYEVCLGIAPVIGSRLGLGALLMLLMLIGGRVVPSFTRNWLKKRQSTYEPAAFSRFDALTLFWSLASLLAWVWVPVSNTLALVLLVAGVLNVVRLSRWQGHRVFADSLVFILHVAYAFIPAGFLLTGLAMINPVWAPGSVAVHVWTLGAVSLMSLAVMTRASLGHMGRPLQADFTILCIYVLLFLCLATRLVASYGLAYREILALSALLWCLAHMLFIVRFSPGFFTQR